MNTKTTIQYSEEGAVVVPVDSEEKAGSDTSSTAKSLSDVSELNCGIQAAILRAPEELLCDLLHDHG